MKTKNPTKEKAQEERIAYQCYACERFDGTFGPVSGQHEHVCEICKGLPTDAADQGPIRKHLEQHIRIESAGGAQGLPCVTCGREADECNCADQELLNEMEMAEAGMEERPARVRVRPRLRDAGNIQAAFQRLQDQVAGAERNIRQDNPR